MRKGLSPIISAILILLIAISMTLLAIIWLPKFIIKIFPQLGFNESYIRSRGCLSIENVDGLFGLFTIKNCGKTALSGFSFFIDSNFINKLNIGTLNPSQSIDFYDMPITGGRHSLYITADYAESPPYVVDVPYWECIGGEPILTEDWYVSKNISCICSYNTIIPAMNVYVRGNGSLSLYNCILQIQYMRLYDNGFLNFNKSTLISPSGGNIAFQGDSAAYIKNSFFNNVPSWFEYASNVTLIDSRIRGLDINSNIHHRLPISNFNTAVNPITVFIKAEDSNFTLNLTNVSFDYSVLQVSDDSNTTIRNSRFDNFFIASEQTHNLTIDNWKEGIAQNLNFKAQGSNFILDAQSLYGGWTLFYGVDNSNNTITNSNIGQIETYDSSNNTFINCSAGTVYLSDNSINVFKNFINDNLNFGFSWYNADNFAKVNFSNTTISNSITFYNYASRTTNITFFGNVTFDSSAYINRFYANVTRNIPTIIKDSGNSVIPTMQRANISITDKFNNSIWQGSVSGGSSPRTYYIEDPLLVFNRSNYGPGNFTMKVSQVCENKTDLNFLNSTPIELTINRSYNYDGTNFNTPEVTGTKRGIAFDNSNFWFASSNGNVSKYTSTGTYVSSFNSTLNGLRDVASNGTYLWLLNYNSTEKRVYRYLPSGSYNNFNFDVSSQVTEPYAVDFDGNNFWVLGNTSVYKYNITGSYTGFSFILSRLAGVYFGDIEFNGGLWVLTENYSSSTGRGVFKYNPDGTYDNWYFDINPPTTTGRGLAYNGTYFWVMNSTGTVFRYSLNRNCLEIMKQCDEFVTFLPYTISKNNMRYCLLYNLYVPSKTAIAFAPGVQSTTLDCLGHNLNSNYVSGSFGVYLTGAGTNSNTIKNCNITNFDYGIRLYNGPSNNFITNNTAGSNSYGIVIDSSSNNIVANNTATNNGGQGIIVFNSGQNDTIADNILINNYQNIHLCNGAANNIVIRNNITGGTYGIYMHDGAGGTASYNNLTYNNISSATYGIYIIEGSHDNLFANSSVTNSGQNDYYLANATSTNNFTNMNFTSSKKIYFNDTTSWFIYSNDTGSIWLSTSVSAQATITRKLVNWDDALMQWNDTFSNTSGSITATYNISGLLPLTTYSVYNNSVPTYSLNSGLGGQINFTINLSQNPAGIIVNISGLFNNVLNLNFNEANGTIAHDKSDYGNDGTFYGETFSDGTFYGETFNDGVFYGETFNDGTLVNTTNGTITRTAGKFGNAVNFIVNGTSNGPYIPLPLNSYLNVSQPVTITAWIYPTSFPDYIVSRTTCCGSTMLYVESSTFKVFWGNYSQTNYVQLNGGTINLNTWYFVAFSYDSSGNAIIYVNGTNVGSTSKNATNYSDILGTNWNIGQYWGGVQSFNGTIDELRIWNRSLSQAEIQAEMQSSLPMSRTIASYRFEEISGQNAFDTHIWVNGTYGSALSFDGSNDYVSIPDSNSFNITDEMTVSAWVYPLTNQSTGGSNQIVQKISYGNSQGFFLREGYNQSHIPSFNVGNGTNSTGNCGSSCWMSAVASKISSNAWHYIVGTVKANDKIRIYVDGFLKAENNFIGNINQSANNMYIGWESATKAFNGTIDEVRIYNRSLSLSEINAEMNSSLPISRPVASYRFEESGNYVNDTHIRVNGTYGSALSFDGINDFVNVSDSPSLDVDNITITAWIYPKSLGKVDKGRIVDKAGAYEFYVYNDSTVPQYNYSLSFYSYNDSSHDQSWSTAYSVQLNQWQHVAVTYDGKYVKFYINGILNNTHLVSAPGPLGKSSSNLYIGYNSTIYDSNTRAFNGTIDEVRIWNRTLSQAEIQAEMNSSMPVSRPVVSYSFEERSGQNAFDTHIWVNGTYGSALSFDGVDDYVKVLDSDSLDIDSAITVSAWIYPTSWSSSNPRIVSKETSILATPYALELKNITKSVTFCIDSGSGENCVESTSNSISLNNWYYITGTWNGTNSKIYINGNLNASLPQTGVMSKTSNNVLIGNNPSNNRQFNGTIDEVRIWGRELNSTEIQAEKNKG